MDAKTRQDLITKYKDGYRIVADALAGCTEKELDARPAPGKWSAREITHHLADSEMIAAIRLRRLITEEQATIKAFDQNIFARRLYYDRPIQASLEAFRAARLSTMEILERMTDTEWARQGTHSESGGYSAEKWLRIYAEHAPTHAEQIRKARAAGK